jgi:hypothetical protein
MMTHHTDANLQRGFAFHAKLGHGVSTVLTMRRPLAVLVWSN